VIQAQQLGHLLSEPALIGGLFCGPMMPLGRVIPGTISIVSDEKDQAGF